MNLAGTREKDSVNQYYEAVKLKDLEYLKACGGPFTAADEAENYMKALRISRRETNKFILREDMQKTCACHSCIHFQSSEYKNLDSSEYAANLKEYFW